MKGPSQGEGRALQGTCLHPRLKSHGVLGTEEVLYQLSGLRRRNVIAVFQRKEWATPILKTCPR